MTSASCRVCHRTLRNPHTVAIGVGPVCAKRLGIHSVPLFIGRGERHPGEELGAFHGDVVCSFLDGEPCTNIAHQWHLHSSKGFKWGRPGAGASDLALNILLNFTDRYEAERLHHDFQFRFLAEMPPEGGVIKRAQILYVFDVDDDNCVFTHTGLLAQGPK